LLSLGSMRASKPKSRGTRLLLVDDSRDGMLARKALLEEQDFVVGAAANGEEAMDALAGGDYSLLITDFRMPKMNGIELIRKVKAMRPELPIILISAFADAYGLDEKSTGADIVVDKGKHEIPNLLRAVTRLLARKVVRKPPNSQKSKNSNGG